MPLRAFLLILIGLVPSLSPLSAAEPATPASRAWQAGQLALEKEQFQKAIGQFELALRLDGAFVPARLSLAAAYLAIGEDERALPHLDRYLQTRPAHLSVRAQYAELLFRLERPAEARGHFERCVVEAQAHPDLSDQHLVHCHTRLMEIAERQGDTYETHLNRGIGLFQLARQRASLVEEGADEMAEGLLCKAAAELTLARLEQPDAGRPCWYLHEVWVKLAQRQPAQRWLRLAEELTSPGDLTPVERRNLQLACGRQEERSRK